MNAIQRFLDSWDDHKHPFVWVKTAEEVIHSLGSSLRTTNNYGRPLATKGLPAGRRRRDRGEEHPRLARLLWAM
jgi:hypothetical protein